MKFRNFLGVFCLLSSVAVIFQNCGKSGFRADMIEGSAVSSSLLPPVPVGPPPTDYTKDSGLISAKYAGTLDPNCLNNPNYDACIFWKNPVSTRGTAFNSMLEFGASLNNEQIFGVKLTNLKSAQRLGSESLNVYYSGNDIDTENKLLLNNGQLRQAYAADGASTAISEKARSVSQVMAYFWLNHLEGELKRRTGTSYSEKSLTHVDAFSIDASLDSILRGNAFFTFGGSQAVGYERYIVMGYADLVRNNQVVKAHEMALSAEVYLHEMGHANLFAAKGNDANGVAFDDNSTVHYRILSCADATYRSDPTKNVGVFSDAKIAELERICDPGATGAFNYTNFQVCKTNQGCFGAINEGQADFHYMMIFPESTALGETIENSLGGFKVGPKYSRQLVSGATYKCVAAVAGTEISRNAEANRGKTMEQFFQGSTLQMNNCSNEVAGEIHGMGSAYASILWEIYTSGKIDTRLFEKAFQAHLQKVGRSTDFSSAWMALRTDYMAVGGSIEGQQAIDQVFTQKGVMKPALL